MVCTDTVSVTEAITKKANEGFDRRQRLSWIVETRYSRRPATRGCLFGYLGRRAATILEGLSIRHVFSFSNIRRLSVRILVSFRSLHCPTLALSLGVRTPLAVRFIRLSPLGIAVSEIFTLLDFNVAGFPICNSLCIAVSRDSRRDRSGAMSLSRLFAQLHCEALTF